MNNYQLKITGRLIIDFSIHLIINFNTFSLPLAFFRQMIVGKIIAHTLVTNRANFLMNKNDQLLKIFFLRVDFFFLFQHR